MESSFRDWWRRHSDNITDDNAYDYFERCWETAQRVALINLRDAPPQCIANAIERARMDAAVEDGNTKYVRSRRDTLRFEKQTLDRAEQRILDQGW